MSLALGAGLAIGGAKIIGGIFDRKAQRRAQKEARKMDRENFEWQKKHDIWNANETQRRNDHAIRSDAANRLEGMAHNQARERDRLINLWS